MNWKVADFINFRSEVLVICYVLLFLWITSVSHNNNKYQTVVATEIIICRQGVRLNVTHQAAAPGAKSDVYDCLVHTFYVWFHALWQCFIVTTLQALWNSLIFPRHFPRPVVTIRGTLHVVLLTSSIYLYCHQYAVNVTAKYLRWLTTTTTITTSV